MKNKFQIILTIFLLLLFCSCPAYSDGGNLKIKSGSFIKVMSLDETDTLRADISDKIKFINLNDVYVLETNAIPKNTIFYGIIEDVREPVRGTDGALKILIDRMIMPEGGEYDIKAHIYNPNSNYTGGKTQPYAYYRKVYTHSARLRPMLQAVPLTVQENGRHTVIRPGTEFFIIIEDDIILK